ncbi:uncharacterized protein LOC142558203 isoform X2 [Dermacentor variabilis]|uniref:uncharacterized protein LOC142558203 isoform X2 n=1 Tax=Dermacentor variabilis TaxID=34621 RepID=UPI003F5C6A29
MGGVPASPLPDHTNSMCRINSDCKAHPHGRPLHHLDQRTEGHEHRDAVRRIKVLHGHQSSGEALLPTPGVRLPDVQERPGRSLAGDTDQAGSQSAHHLPAPVTREPRRGDRGRRRVGSHQREWYRLTYAAVHNPGGLELGEMHTGPRRNRLLQTAADMRLQERFRRLSGRLRCTTDAQAWPHL